MQEWWEGLSQILRLLYCIAVPSTLILVLQLILSMAGGHSDGGVDVSDTSGLDTGTDMGDLSDLSDIGDAGDADLGDVGQDGGNPADFGTLRLFSLQTIITFLTVFSWISIVCIGARLNPAVSMLIGAASGIAMMFAVAKMVQLSARLAENGTMNLKYAIGETATVYLTVPPSGEGEGKVNLNVQGTFGEFNAVNAGSDPLPTGSKVLVTDVIGGTLVVSADA